MGELDALETIAAANGRGSVAAALEARPPAVFRVTPRYEVVILADPFEGAWARMHINPGDGVVTQLNEGGATMHKTLAGLLQEWNIGDVDGNVLPISEAGVAAVPSDMLLALMQAWGEHRTLPKPKNSS